jgi:hypothetical protein
MKPLRARMLGGGDGRESARRRVYVGCILGELQAPPSYTGRLPV